MVSTFCAQDSQWATKRVNFFLRIGPIGPSFRSMDYASENLPLKTTQHYFGLGCYPDQTQLGSTKPDMVHSK